MTHQKRSLQFCNQFSLHLNCQIHTQLSKCPSCGVSHINTVSVMAKVNVDRWVKNGYVSVYYIHSVLKGQQPN